MTKKGCKVKKQRLFFSIITLLSFCFANMVFAESKISPKPQVVIVEFRLVCKPDYKGIKMITKDGKEELCVEGYEHGQLVMDDVSGARANTSTAQPGIELKFTEQGKEKLAKWTSENIGRRLAVIINEELIAAPVIKMPITDGVIEVEGMLTQKYVDDVVSGINTIIGQQQQLQQLVKVTQNNLGDLLNNDKDKKDKALLKVSDKLIEINPNDANAYVIRGLAYAENGRYDQATHDFNKAIEMNPNLAEAYSGRGYVYTKQGNYDQAILEYNKAVQIDSKDPMTYWGRGYAYYKKDNLDQAISDYSKALEISSKCLLAYYNRGLAYYRTGQHDKALSDYTLAVNLKAEKESYDDFIKDVPSKSPSDTNDIREQILQLFKEKLGLIEKAKVMERKNNGGLQ